MVVHTDAHTYIHTYINQSSLRLFEKKILLTQTQEGCTIELKNRETKYVCSEIKRIWTVRR